jgi:signal transduction histidine kinase/CheY-like chemotaxis protein
MKRFLRQGWFEEDDADEAADNDEFSHNLFTLWFKNPHVETQHRRLMMIRTVGPCIVIGCVYALSNQLIDEHELNAEHWAVNAALQCHIFGPLICAGIWAYLYVTRSQTRTALAAFEFSICLQVFSDGLSQAVLAAYRGMPIPAGVFGVACMTPLTKQNWIYNAILSVTFASVYYVMQGIWHPDMVNPTARLDSARAFVAYIVIGYLSDINLRTQTQARLRLRKFKKHLDSSVANMVNSEQESSDTDSSNADGDPNGTGHLRTDKETPDVFQHNNEAANPDLEHFKTLKGNRSEEECSSSAAIQFRKSTSPDDLDWQAVHSETQHGHQESKRMVQPLSFTKRMFYEKDSLLYMKDVLRHARDVTKLFAAAEQRQSTFLATMSHQLRSPLTSILGCSELLVSDTDITEKCRHLVKVVLNSGNHLLSLVNDILDFSKMTTSNKFNLKPSAFNVHDLADRVFQLFEEKARDKDINFEINCEGVPERLILFGDVTRIHQIIVNLVSNAIKFTSAAGQVILTLDAEAKQKVDSEGDLILHTETETDEHQRWILHIAVSDTGCGISQEDQERLFQPFAQVGSHAPSTKGGGIGLGLCVSSQLAKFMGCSSIKVESELQKGTTFSTDLYLEEPPPGTHVIPAFSLHHLTRDDIDVSPHAFSTNRMSHEDVSSCQYPGSMESETKVDQEILQNQVMSQEVNLQTRTSWIRHTSGPNAYRSEENVSAAATASTAAQTPFTDIFREDAPRVSVMRRRRILSGKSEKVNLRRAPLLNALRGQHILLVEDVASIRATGAMMIRRAGGEVSTANNGRAAVTAVAASMAASTPFDCVLMDLHMPIMDGIEAIHIITRIYGSNAPPMIGLIDADEWENSAQQMRQSGAVEIFAKPYNLPRLVRILEDYCG